MIAYASRTLNKAEQNYDAHKLEFLALKWAITDRFHEYLKLKPSKCELFETSLKYLGHIVSEKGIATDPTKIKAIRNWPVPKTVTDVRSFARFTNYYRKFIKDYAKVARLLNELISGDNAKKKCQLVQLE